MIAFHKEASMATTSIIPEHCPELSVHWAPTADCDLSKGHCSS